MKAWALRNPMLARVLLRLVLRMAVALAVVIPLMPMMERYGVSPNIAAITAVVVVALAVMHVRLHLGALRSDRGGGRGRSR